MSRESESEQTQRTVAELLAQYGGGSGEVAPRRRRRRAEDASDTAPQAIIDRVNSDSGRLLPVRDEPPPAAPPPAPPPVPPPAPPSSRSTRGVQRAPETEAERTAYAPPPPPLASPQAPPLAPPPLPTRPTRATEAERTTYAPPVPAAPPAVDPAEETRVVPPITDDPADFDDYAGEPSRPQPRPAVDRPPAERPAPEPPRAAQAEPTHVGIDPSRLTPDPTQATRVVRPAVPPAREPVTEVLPRINDQLTPNVPLEALPTESVLIVPPAPPELPDPLPDQSAEDWFGQDGEEEGEEPGGESTQFHPYVDLDEEDEEEGYPPPRRFDDDEGPAGLADVGDDDEDEEPADRSPAREWLIMIGQLAVGVVGGAALWLGFSFLWRSLAPAALVVALAVTVGLVMLVRRIRRADDLQTTVLAVLVGLIVTVSPAAMLLVKS